MCLVEMGRREKAARCILESHKKVLGPRMTNKGLSERIKRE
jgi:hypothetical protein